MFYKLFFLLIPLLCTHAWHNNPLLRQDGEQGKENYCGIHDGLEESREMLNEWTVVVDGDEVMAKYVAVEMGFIYVGPVLGFSNTYIFEKTQHSIERRTFPNTSSIQVIKHRQVKWSQQMFVKLRAKRHLLDQELFRAKRLRETEEKVLEKKDSHNRIEPIFNDELWEAEWYLQDSQHVVCSPRLDLNVLPVYEMGYNGHGVRVSILDDGIEHQHTDLKINYDPEISWDCNDRDEDPSPRLDDLQENSHGTRCAGEIAMAANNKKCGVGVAWGARIGGVRMLDGKITDRVEAEAISYAWDKVDIYSVSWGPYDDGKTVEGPGELALEAILRGIHKGRNGKGNIYVWANGNGGGKLDNCNCDGYSASIYTISVGSASQQGRFPWYGEVCSSTLATAYSSGASEDQKIATTDTNNSCTLSHTGTSAAAPLAAGIIALVLQANPNLTWRDVQHLIVWTSDFTPLFDNPGWQANGIGLLYNIRFGFGLLNAGALVTMARQWVNVPDKHVCKIAAPIEAKQVQLGSRKTDVINVMVKECPIKFIEHVEVIVNIEYTRRGALEIYLGSPEGTAVQLLSPRPYDRSSKGFVNWSLMSVATWGENPSGNWQINILERTHEHNIGYVGSLTLVIHGTLEMPNSSLLNSYLQSKYDFEEAEEHLEMEQENDNLINAEYRDAEDHTSKLKDIDQELLRYHHKITNN